MLKHDSAFSIITDFGMKMTSCFTGAISEFHFVIIVAIEEGSEEVCNSNGSTLSKMMHFLQMI